MITTPAALLIVAAGTAPGAGRVVWLLAARRKRRKDGPMDPREALEFYRDPAHLEPAGPARRRKGPHKTSMVAVRFDPAVIEQCRDHAAAGDVTVSTWIRRAVDRALERPSGLIGSSARTGEPKALPSAPCSPVFAASVTVASWNGTARCPHMTVGNVIEATCGICGPMAVEHAVAS